MSRICFVILHYIAFDQTVECVNTIKVNLPRPDCEIIIVDNCSPNGSGKKLFNKYIDDSQVTVIINPSNMGFAKGNNVGIDYAIKKINPQYVCCLNNDVLIHDREFLSKIEKEFVKSNCGVIGPRIYLKNGELFRFESQIKDISFYKAELERYKCIGSTSDLISGDGKRVNRHLKMKISLIRLLKKIKLLNLYRGLIHKAFFRREGVILHGCCLVFTPSFFAKMRGFDDRTFLYMEEILLYIHCKKNNVLTVYCPNIRVTHLEDCATAQAWGQSIKQKKARHMADSISVVINELESDVSGADK